MPATRLLNEYRPFKSVVVVASMAVPVLFSSSTLTPGTPGPESKLVSLPVWPVSRNTMSPIEQSWLDAIVPKFCLMSLHPNPDRIVESRLSVYPHCAALCPDEAQTPQQVYERIERPPIKPDVTQVRLFGGRCACCQERVTASAPAGLEQGSPFGQTIAAMVVYLHGTHAIGMERLVTLMGELFGLSISEGAISEGAICNILARAREPLLDAAAAIEKVVLASSVVCSDETSVRVKGKNWWEVRQTPHGTLVRFAARWVFIGTLAALHVIRPSCGKAVVTDLFGTIRPAVWVSDRCHAKRSAGWAARKAIRQWHIGARNRPLRAGRRPTQATHRRTGVSNYTGTLA